ncbi:MAG: PilT/PilU family type 4a pilus ATPase, partial [Candidatus Omnitrophota bacterium]
EEPTLLSFLAGFLHDTSAEQTLPLRVADSLERLMLVDLRSLLAAMVDLHASDLHLLAGSPAQARINGDITAISDRRLSGDEIRGMVYEFLSGEERRCLEELKSLDRSFELSGLGRYRINFHWQQDSLAVSIRLLPLVIPSLEELGAPDIIKEFISYQNGLVLITGPAGSGKSTTLAAAIEYMNLKRASNIITIEDPIEYVFESKKSLIRQRELGRDTLSYAEALRSVLRQDPNIILVGEMRDAETMQAVVTLAETGHLIFSTLHTRDTVNAISRIVDMFPVSHQHEARIKIGSALRGVITQQLIPRKDGRGRVLACEILNCTDPVRNLIKENRLSHIRPFIQMGARFGMRSMNHSLLELSRQGVISVEEARQRSNDKEEFNRLMLEG